MIGHLPLWLVIYVWLLQRRNTPRVTVISCPKMLTFLEDMYRMLPLPKGKLQWWIYGQIAAWIDQEKARLSLLRDIGAVMTGVVKK